MALRQGRKDDKDARIAELEAQLAEAQADGGFCPECGSYESTNPRHTDTNYRVCSNCGQERWIDIDYSSVIAAHLGELAQAQADAEQLRNVRYDFASAIEKLPEIPSVSVLEFLSSAAYSAPSIVKDKGKELQRIHGIKMIPPTAEIEWAAGLWSVIRDAMREGDE